MKFDLGTHNPYLSGNSLKPSSLPSRKKMGNSQASLRETKLTPKEAIYIRDLFLLARRVQKVPHINRYTLPFIRAVEDLALAIQGGKIEVVGVAEEKSFSIAICARDEIHLLARIAEKRFFAWQKATFGGAAFIQYEYHWMRSADSTFVA